MIFPLSTRAPVGLSSFHLAGEKLKLLTVAPQGDALLGDAGYFIFLAGRQGELVRGSGLDRRLSQTFGDVAEQFAGNVAHHRVVALACAPLDEFANT